MITHHVDSSENETRDGDTAGTLAAATLASSTQELGAPVRTVRGRGDDPRVALEYNVGRTAGTMIQDTRIRLNATCLKLLAALTGLWIEQGGRDCSPAVGRHRPSCPHADNRIRYSLRELARLLCGADGGSQIKLVRKALSDIAGNTTEIRVVDAAGNYYWRKSHLISVVEVGRRSLRQGRVRGGGTVAWDPFVLENLMAGRFQFLPFSILRELGGADFLVWMAVLMRPGSALLRQGQRTEFSVGIGEVITPDDLGLPGVRADRLPKTLARAAARGNAVQGTWHLEVQPRASGAGHKLVLRLLQERSPRARARQAEPSGAATGATKRGTAGQRVRQSKPSYVLETARGDRASDSRSDVNLDSGLTDDAVSARGDERTQEWLALGEQLFGKKSVQ